MDRRLNGVSLLLIMIVIFQPAGVALADAAPPQYPPGGDVGTGDFETNVQMMSENVLITVESTAPDPALSGTYASGLIGYDTRAHVDAFFYMVNQGSEVESFDVWFPIGGSNGYSDELSVDNFAAWVGDTPAETGTAYTEPENFEDPSVWATWPVTFYPGQTVTLHVAYYVRPTGYQPYGRFEYLLHTGAGWHGSIGEGTVTVRLPYPVNDFNTVLTQDEWESPSPDYYSVSGSEITWQFSNLEPSQADDIGVTVLQPSVWQAIQSAEEDVQQDPDNPAMHLSLARARADALYMKHGLEPIGRNVDMARLAMDSYEQAIDLSPDDIDLYVEYLGLLQSIWFEYDPLDGVQEKIDLYLERALELAPDDERLKDIQSFVENYVVTPAPIGQAPTALTQTSASPSPLPAATSERPTTAPTTAPPTAAPVEPAASSQSTPRGSKLPCASAALILLPAATIAGLARKRSR